MAVKCLLDEANRSAECKNRCARCGWNPDVVKARNAKIAANGLTKGPDGVSRLIIQKGGATNGGNT